VIWRIWWDMGWQGTAMMIEKVEPTPDNAKPLAPTAVSYPSGNETI
jgi:hypothetical protein